MSTRAQRKEEVLLAIEMLKEVNEDLGVVMIRVLNETRPSDKNLDLYRRLKEIKTIIRRLID